METRTVAGIKFSVVKKQRSGICIYRAPGSYLRIGPPEIITRHLEEHRRLESWGFPVPKIMREGNQGGEKYFIEVSLGEKRFLEIFEDDIARNGTIRDESFESFLAVMEEYLEAQVRSPDRPREHGNFAQAVRLSDMARELPHYAERIAERFEATLARLNGFPFKVMHGDLGPANMYPRGVIDFEDIASGPAGFDAASAIMVSEWFPRGGDYEFLERARFTDAQIAEYLRHCDAIFARNGLPKFSEHFEEFAFFRAMWFSVRMQEWPKLQKYRHNLFIKKYLA